MGRKFVSWRRVSTERQNKSGLGLEAQKAIINYFVDYEKGELIADYKECHTGTSLSTCVELKKAMAHCKHENACLIIAKVDRFRTVIEALQILDYMGEGNLFFCDMPSSDRFSLTLYTALAEREALLVSIRTKQALAVKKRQGCKLGGQNEKWQETYNNKSKEQKEKEQMRKGETKRQRYHENVDTKTFLRVLKMVQPEHCASDDPKDWEWKGIDTKCGRREQMLTLMKNFQENDEEGRIFRKWDFTDISSKKNRDGLCAYIQRIRKSFLI